ncbi:acyl-CoA synthetase family (AMP-forming)/AMP-acid ligase family protein (macronuclear) [Tetrahymena thermophila SB210]|uniref:Acyl-CoA synthetase family (AMP-forming)/AMP-acid ligase family protein n=1 Tax=Tetrahymena thermophila (strain SB210) TaxID=312017 RepID=Q22W89_TETTS|nr:acyl-CoA synthetase family (AMP-forming)/AMP-acid ligase family protein [Tetrahymena thermophila SB210]EAR89528.1 acyl-CoA synthetase family (AMP-forming)/AMP-acid ligase family protein [Tetrahymena thermophila SB210]|eukprot:XP_001009773.1 acyl-CoA synthetase family (AMP-forming)/AMP-acid ligase family protein [Tetrahymena thermophila SB210]
MIRNIIKYSFTKRSISNAPISLSYVHGVSSKPLSYITIGEKLREQAYKISDQVAIISHLQKKQFTYSELYRTCEKVAASLLSLGLKKGDRIGIYSPNNYEWVITQYAASMADLILVNINPAYQEHELEYCLKKVGVKAIVMASHHRKSDYVKFINNIVPELQTSDIGKLKSAKLPNLKFVIRIDDEKTPGMMSFKSLYELAGSKDYQKLHTTMRITEPDDATNIQFTSGTTGNPKGATLTHFNILNNGYLLGQRLGLVQSDKICLSVPLYHCFGMVMGNLAALNYGSTIVLPSEGFNPQHSMQSVGEYQITTMYGVPTMFYEYIKEYEHNPKLYNISTLRKGIMAGALCPQSLMSKLINEWKMTDLQIAYGMTETSPISFQTESSDNLEDKCGTVGKIFPHTEAKIINSKGKILERGQSGELCIRGYPVMQKYWADIRNTNKTIDTNGWLKTGDVAVMDDRGYVKIVGRIKEMIIRGGENIYPKEIEEFLRTHPSIMDVQVVGVPNQKFGEETFALIRLKQNQEVKPLDIAEFCKGQIAHYKVPKYVKFVDSFPLTITGKPQKFKMVASIKEEMNGSEQNLDKYSIRSY